MTRITVQDQDGNYTGWFTRESAQEFKYEHDWDGSNHIDRNTGSQWDHEFLYRTSGGRWVLNTWSQRQGVTERYRYISEDDALAWLIRNGHEAAATEYGADDERGPGRPTVGNVVNVRLGDLLAQVDNYAAGKDITRAEAIRELVTAGLSAS